MKPAIIDKIPFEPDINQLTEKLKVKSGSPHSENLRQLIVEAKEIAKPKAMYKISSVVTNNKEDVMLDGEPFHSRVLCVNLDGIHRAFPYLATCGIELHKWANSFKDPLIGYFADAITGLALRSAREILFSELTSKYGLGKTATMSPGSLEDWPIQAQIPLFSLLGDPGRGIGINLTESLLMIPRQSVSGVLFETEKDFVNCQLCPRKKCSNRKAAYDLTEVAHYLS